jgi:hypothetical protein
MRVVVQILCNTDVTAEDQHITVVVVSDVYVAEL